MRGWCQRKPVFPKHVRRPGEEVSEESGEADVSAVDAY